MFAIDWFWLLHLWCLQLLQTVGTNLLPMSTSHTNTDIDRPILVSFCPSHWHSFFFGLLCWLFLSLLEVESAGRSVDQQSVGWLLGLWVGQLDNGFTRLFVSSFKQSLLVDGCFEGQLASASQAALCKHPIPFAANDTCCSRRVCLPSCNDVEEQTQSRQAGRSKTSKE